MRMLFAGLILYVILIPNVSFFPQIFGLNQMLSNLVFLYTFWSCVEVIASRGRKKGGFL